METGGAEADLFSFVRRRRMKKKHIGSDKRLETVAATRAESERCCRVYVAKLKIIAQGDETASQRAAMVEHYRHQRRESS